MTAIETEAPGHHVGEKVVLEASGVTMRFGGNTAPSNTT